MSAEPATPAASSAPASCGEDTGAARVRPVPPGPWPVVERGFHVLKRQNWKVVVSGFFEPVFYLLAMGYGLGGLVGSVTGPHGEPISYAAYIAPALLASAAMNGAILDATWNVFFKLKFARLYEGMLATPLAPVDVAVGEIVLALFRGLLYAVGFMGVLVVLGLVVSWWAIGMIPVALLIAFGFAALGFAATSYARSFQQMDLIFIVLLPMFLFSSTLYPIDVYPTAIQWLVMALPLWHGIELMRQLAFGAVGWSTVGHAAYFVVLAVVGIALATRRLRALFLR